MVPSIISSFYKPPSEWPTVLQHMLAKPPVARHLFVHGAPGIGKSAMSDALYARWEQVQHSLESHV